MVHRVRHLPTPGLIALVVSVSLLATALPVRAQDAIAVVLNEHEHVFKGPMIFRLEAKSSTKINSIKLFYRVSGQTSAHKAVLEFDAATRVTVEHTEDMGEESNYQPPMIEFTCWWVIQDEGGNRLKTDLVSFVYEDTSYSWHVLENERVRLYWHDHGQQFGQGYFDLAAAAAASLAAEFGVTSKTPVAIVIYNTHEELMSVLQEASSDWTGAVNFGKSGTIAIGLGSASWMKAVIPHELTHATLYQVTKPPFGDIPRWLHEGLAVRSEGGMSIEERAVLAKAIEDDTLISLRVLNSPFADHRDRAILSYAESNSLVEFIIETYGSDKLSELISVFAEGAHYDDAVIEVFDVDMDGLENLWRAHIGAQPLSGTTRATPVPSATLQPSPTPTSEKERTPTATAASLPAATATAWVATPTLTAISPPEAGSTATPTPPPRSGAPCLGAVPTIAVIALFVIFHPRAVPG